MGAFILKTPGCTPVDAWRLYRRILVCFLTGNTDAHLKNFAMFHTRDGLRLTPAYDLVSAALYPECRTLALAIGGAANLTLEQLKPKHLAALGRAYELGPEILAEAVQNLDRRRIAMQKAVMAAGKRIGQVRLAIDLLDFMERRWNGTFKSIGQFLSKKLSGDVVV
jgi:serine/threonine-protein kinase HipA